MAGDDRALIVIDVQNDFCPGGALAVAEGDLVVAAINRVAGGFPVRVLTQDWHPPHHRSFAANHPDAEPFSYGGDALRPAGALAGALRAGQRRRRVPPGARDRRGRPDPAQGVPGRDRQLLGLLRERPARPRPGSPATCASGRCGGCGWRGSPPTSASPIRRSTPRGAGFEVTVLEDACRAIDLDGSLAAAMRSMAERGVAFARAAELAAR